MPEPKEPITNKETINIFLKTLKKSLKNSLNPSKKFNQSKQAMPQEILKNFYNFKFLNKHNYMKLKTKLVDLIYAERINKETISSTNKNITKFKNIVKKHVNWTPFTTKKKDFVEYRNSLLMLDAMRNIVSDLINEIWDSFHFHSNNQDVLDFNITKKTGGIFSDEWEIKGMNKLDKALNDFQTENYYGDLFNNKQNNSTQMIFASKALQDLNIERHTLKDYNIQAFKAIEVANLSF